jgi:sugar phosphate isomerase/epimerase
MKFGASIWPFKWDTPYGEAIPRIARLGFTAIELIAWDRQTLETYYTPSRIKELRSIIANEGLELSEFVSTPRGMADPDPNVRAQSVEHFKRMLEVADGLGTTMVNSVSVHPFNLEFPRITDRPLMQEQLVEIPTGLDWRRNWEEYVDVMRQCAELCERAGFRYALEPHPYRYMANAAGMLRLLDHVPSPALGMNFDPSHLYPAGEIPQMVIYQLGDRVFHCHFSDNDGMTNAHWRPGKGKIDWQAVLVALKDVGFDGVISIELEDVPGVSRRVPNATGAVRSGQEASAAFDAENVASVRYLLEIADRIGVQIEWGGTQK